MAEMGEWLHRYLPAIPPEFGNGSPCWIARMKTRSAEHNPPYYWLARALDIVHLAGAEETVRARLEAAHDTAACDGGAQDDRAQGVLSEACAFAWTHTHIGVPRIEVTTPGASIAADRVRLHVPDHDGYVLPSRLRAPAGGGEAFAGVRREVRAAEEAMPPASGRLLYLDVLYGRTYPQSVGYDLGLTEPVLAALRHACGEAHIGHVLTRPFQWGNPVAAHY